MNQHNQIDLTDEIKLWGIWNGKKFLILVVIASSFATIFVHLCMPNIYQIKLLLSWGKSP